MVGCLQLLNIPIINLFFQPRTGISETGNWFLKGGEGIAGTFQYVVHYGYFILSSFIILFSTNLIKTNKYLLVIFSLAFSYFSGSRLAVLIVILFLSYRLYNSNNQYSSPAFFATKFNILFEEL